MGWMEFIMSIIEKFRENQYQAYIAAGMKDPVLIQEYIKIAENFIFNDQQFTQDEHNEMKRRLVSLVQSPPKTP